MTAHIDHDLEAMIVGQVLASKDALGTVLASTKPDDFNSEVYARIIDSAVAIAEEGYHPSPVLIRPLLSAETVRKIEGANGIDAAEFLARLANAASPFQSVAALAERLADMARRRRLDAELEAARERLEAYDRPAGQAISAVLDAAGEVLAANARRAGHRPTTEASDEMLRRLQDAMNGKRQASITSGLRRLDQVTGGLQAGDSVIIAGRPGMGKSLLLAGTCRAAATAGYPAILFSLEMPREQLLHRLTTDIEFDRKLPGQATVSYSRLRAGKITDAEFERVYSATQQLKSLPLEIYDAPAVSMHEIAATAKNFARNKPLGVIAIDYLQLVRVSDRYRGSRALEIGEITGAAKELSRQIGWPIIMGCQLNRAVESTENKHPTLSNLRESGSIEQDADIVLGLYRAAYYVEQRRPTEGQFDPGWANWKSEWLGVKDKLEICVLKNRNGPTPVIGVSIDLEAGAIRNAREQLELTVVT